MFRFTVPLIFVIFLLLAVKSTHGQRIKLKDIEVLTLYKDKLTASNRLGAIPQLKCVGSFSNCYHFSPNVVQCYNKGFDGIEVQWECKAELDSRVHFDMVKVTCEGYDSDIDSYVLAGSCGLEYSIETAFKGQKHFADYYHRDLYETSKLSNFLSLAIIAIIILGVYKSCIKNRENEPRHDFNSTYAQIINQSDSLTPNEDIYPPPPPPYAGFNSVYDSTHSKPECEQATPFIQYPTQPANQSNSTSSWNSFLTGATVGVVGNYLFTRRNETSSSNSPIPRTESPPPAYETESNNNDITSTASTTTTVTGFASTSR